MDARVPLPRAGVTVSETRVELGHGLLVEWFENRPEGLEQGWTIRSAPGGAEPLWIGVVVTGDLALRIEAGARDGVFIDGADIPLIRYRGLKAWDATGREQLLAKSPQKDVRYDPKEHGWKP